MGSQWNNSDILTVGRYGHGTLNVEEGGIVNSLPIAHTVGTGVATIAGAGSQWNLSGPLSVGAGGHATLNVEAGGMVSNTVGYIGESPVPLAPDATAVAMVAGRGSHWSNSLALYLGGTESAAVAKGMLNVRDNGQISVGTTLKIWETGTLNLDGGTVQAETIDHTHLGRFNFISGTLDVGIFDGNLIQNGGTMVIGSSPGITHVTGNYDQLNGAIEIEIFAGAGGSPVAGMEFDQLTADSVTLSGTLDLVVDPGYSPAIGDMLTIIDTTTGVSGEFSAVNNVYLPGGLTFEVMYGTHEVMLEVVPEPSSFALIGVGLFVVSYCGRKRAPSSMSPPASYRTTVPLP
jgi:T5SS/PEP-CTERM-associated repeat protein